MFWTFWAFWVFWALYHFQISHKSIKIHSLLYYLVYSVYFILSFFSKILRDFERSENRWKRWTEKTNITSTSTSTICHRTLQTKLDRIPSTPSRKPDQPSTATIDNRRSRWRTTSSIVRQRDWIRFVTYELSLFSLSRPESALRRRRIISVSRHGVMSHHIVSGSGCERMDSRYFCTRGSSAGGLCGSSAVIPSRSPHLETLRFWRLTPYRSFLIPLLNAYTRAQQQFHRKSNRKKRLWYPR